jgi:hypothetical protein
MIAMTWRQHRAQFLIAGIIVAAVVGYLLFGAWQHDSYARQLGLTTCLNATTHRDCGPLAEAFFTRFGGVPGPFTLLAILPLFAGMFFGAPLIAREAESGTLKLAWTQSIDRRRWLTVKLAAFIAAIIVAAVAISAAFSAWLSVYERISSAGYSDVNRMASPAFDLTGVAPLGAMLFAFALGTTAGVLIRRTVPAIAVTVGGYIGAVLPLTALRYTAFIAPRKVSGSYANTRVVQPGAYTLNTTYSNAAGHNVDFSVLWKACARSVGHGETGIRASCLAAKGFHLSQAYQPAANYWPLQLIYTGILVVVAVALIALTAWKSAKHAA